ncbi:MAG: hypothetical protein HZB19_06740 [Chloroflexi bacterium]|nr:hypothetical protein [Chloroflexota bacterium]
MRLRFRSPALVMLFGLSLLLAGCLPADLEGHPAPALTAVPQAASSNISASPCFESGCHANLRSNDGRYIHEPYQQEKCLDCHVIFHQPETQRLYAQSDIDLCYGCHLLDSLGNTHPVGEGVIDPNTGQMMTCTSTCHLSHTAPYPFLLSLRPDGELCVSCHEEFLNP